MRNYKEITSKSEYVQARYFKLLLKKAPIDGWVYFNGSQGERFAIYNNQIAATYDEAVTELSDRESESEEDIINDYKNWYYLVPVAEAMNAIDHDIKYYHPFIKYNPYNHG